MSRSAAPRSRRALRGTTRRRTPSRRSCAGPLDPLPHPCRDRMGRPGYDASTACLIACPKASADGCVEDGADADGRVGRLAHLEHARAELGIILPRREVGEDLLDLAIDDGLDFEASGHGGDPTLR